MTRTRSHILRTVLTGLTGAAGASGILAQSPCIAQIPCRYDVAAIIKAPDCPIFGTPVTVATGISPNGRYVVGSHRQCDLISNEAFVYDTLTRQLLTLPRPAGVYTAYASDVNDEGLMVGSHGRSSGPSPGFIYDITTRQYVASLAPHHPDGQCVINAINASGTVCGTRHIGTKSDPVYLQNAFIWSPKDGFTDLGLINGESTSAADINDKNAVTGSMGIGQETRPFIWVGEQLTELGSLAGMETVPFALNESNLVVGRSRVAQKDGTGFTQRAFRWDGKEMTDLGVLQGQSPPHNLSMATEITEGGTVFGFSRTLGESNDRPWVWHTGEVRDLNELVEPELGIFILGVGEVNEEGDLSGAAIDQEGNIVGVVLEAGPAVRADIDGNCVVNVTDLLILISEWGSTQSAADINQDGVVDRLDLLLLIEEWTQ